MRRLILKLHIYCGLLSFTHLIVYGIAGLAATFAPGLERPKIPYLVRHVPFQVAPNTSDKEVARRVWETLQLPLTRPTPDWFLQHTSAGDLQLDFYNMNGIHRVIVLEREQRLRIEEIRNGIWTFLGDVHAATTGDREAPRLVRVWAVWNEFAMWCLLGFCTSGVYLWLSSRPRFVWAYVCLTTGTLLFGALYFAIR